MQNFMPFPDFEQTAKCLDMRRLGKQRCETLQMLQILDKERQNPELIGKLPWSNHPAIKAYRGFGSFLREYGLIICQEWRGRGYKDTCYDKIFHLFEFEKLIIPPWFINNPDFHKSHQSNLIRKLPSHYRPIFGSEIPDNLSYIWPV